jgi:hypothetical protein
MLLMEWNIKIGAKATRRRTAVSENIPEKIRGSDPERWLGFSAYQTQIYETS